MTKINSSLLAFETHLDELMLLIENNEFIPKLKGSLNTIVNWEIIGQEQRSLVTDFYKLKSTPSRSLYNSIYLSSVASFESYLTQMIEGVVEMMSVKYLTFDKLPQSFINKHMELTGKILSSVHSPPSHLSIDLFKIGRTIGTVHPDSDKVELNTEIAGYVKQILELDGLIKFVNNCGIELDFDFISSHLSIRQIFGTTKTRETSKELKAFLEDTKKMRNRIAHTGQSASDITAESIRIQINRLRVISRRLADVLSQKLA